MLVKLDQRYDVTPCDSSKQVHVVVRSSIVFADVVRQGKVIIIVPKINFKLVSAGYSITRLKHICHDAACT